MTNIPCPEAIINEYKFPLPCPHNKPCPIHKEFGYMSQLNRKNELIKAARKKIKAKQLT